MKRSARTICALVFLAASVLPMSTAAAGPSALLEGGAEFILTPMDVNSDGLVVGYGKPVGSSYWFAWAWRDGQPMEIVGQIGGPGYIPSSWYLHDVNDAGQAVGWYRWWNADRERVDVAALLWEEGVGITLLEYPEGTDQCKAIVINNAGQVAGQCFDSYGEPTWLNRARPLRTSGTLMERSFAWVTWDALPANRWISTNRARSLAKATGRGSMLRLASSGRLTPALWTWATWKVPTVSPRISTTMDR